MTTTNLARLSTNSILILVILNYLIAGIVPQNIKCNAATCILENGQECQRVTETSCPPCIKYNATSSQYECRAASTTMPKCQTKWKYCLLADGGSGPLSDEELEKTFQRVAEIMSNITITPSPNTLDQQGNDEVTILPPKNESSIQITTPHNTTTKRPVTTIIPTTASPQLTSENTTLSDNSISGTEKEFWSSSNFAYVIIMLLSICIISTLLMLYYTWKRQQSFRRLRLQCDNLDNLARESFQQLLPSVQSSLQSTIATSSHQMVAKPTTSEVREFPNDWTSWSYGVAPENLRDQGASRLRRSTADLDLDLQRSQTSSPSTKHSQKKIGNNEELTSLGSVGTVETLENISALENINKKSEYLPRFLVNVTPRPSWSRTMQPSSLIRQKGAALDYDTDYQTSTGARSGEFLPLSNSKENYFQTPPNASQNHLMCMSRAGQKKTHSKIQNCGNIPERSSSYVSTTTMLKEKEQSGGELRMDNSISAWGGSTGFSVYLTGRSSTEEKVAEAKSGGGADENISDSEMFYF